MILFEFLNQAAGNPHQSGPTMKLVNAFVTRIFGQCYSLACTLVSAYQLALVDACVADHLHILPAETFNRTRFQSRR